MKRKKTKSFNIHYLCMIWIYIIAHICVTTTATAQDANIPENYNFRCFNEKNDNIQSLSLSSNKTIGIQVTNRTTHQIISRIFAMYLREILNYQDIKLIPFVYSKHEEVKKIIETLFRIQYPKYDKIPTIDLEVWTIPTFRKPMKLENTISAGIVTSPGRFGLFAASNILASTNKTTTAQNLHYSLLMNPKSDDYQTFLLTDINFELIKNISTENNYREFVPKQCENVKCVTFLSEYWEDTNFIENILDISPLMYAKVIWLGANLKHTIDILINNNNIHKEPYLHKKLIILHWTPSDVINIDSIHYEMFVMPPCEVYGDNYKLKLCKFELTPISKYYSEYFEKVANKITIKALEKFYIPGHELNELLIEFNKNKLKDLNMRYDQVACNWLKKKKDIEYSWVANETNKIYIGGIFPLSTGMMSDVVTAVLLARDAINANANILPNITLVVNILDGACRSDAVMSSFITYHMKSNIVGVLGPACSETVEPIASISKIAELPVISYAAEGASFNDRETYPYIFRTIGSNRQYEDVYIKLFKHFNWRRIAALTEDGQKYTEYITHMENLLKKNDIELILNKKFPKEASINVMIRCLKDLKDKHAKIIIADILNENAQLVMCAAHKLQMTAAHGYVWFLPFMNMQQWKKNVNCTKDELSRAINGHFSLSHVPFASNDSQMQENKTVGQWFEDTKLNIVSNYAGFAYDAVWVFALAADKLWRKSPASIYAIRSPESVMGFVKNVEKLDFNGVSGRVRFGEGGSRIADIQIRQLVNNVPRNVGKYIPETSDVDNKIINGTLYLNATAFEWRLFQNGQPKDGTFDCSLSWFAEFMNTDCDNSVFYLAIFLGLIFVILISLTSSLFWKRRYDEKRKMLAKRIQQFSPSPHLDKWEVSRENVVMNRRLGEGAFGTVFGGEAKLDDAGWSAVAIKTLKIGSPSNNLVDFLHEAEAMKRFDHKNIIKLLGVCIQSEPIFTIMEFMLYGDLKTFLLARRHMVNEKVTEDSDICSKRLTLYALDVARGLSYLNEQNFVHRDIACRNCLVNAQRVVKLADFGMARPVFESNYYRFFRTGLLPVRWMAPESLDSAIFTPSSDVWSFGVLLYEIITFGSFPYQGLTNNQVLEYVKNGNTLKIPENVKPHLEGLMSACWMANPKKRPKASEITEYISDHPSLLTPCLDVPIASVEMPETESDQMELLHNKKKKRSNKPKSLDILQQTSNLNNFDENSFKGNKPNNMDTIEIPMESLNVQPFSEETNVDSNCPLLTDSDSTPNKRSSSSNSLNNYVLVGNNGPQIIKQR